MMELQSNSVVICSLFTPVGVLGGVNLITYSFGLYNNAI